MIRAAILLAALLASVPAMAEPVVPLRLNGPDTGRVNMVFLGDGFTAAQLNYYAYVVDRHVNHFFSQEPFKEYASYFNVYRVDVTSNESGSDHPEWQQTKDTALGTSYSCRGGPQYYMCYDQRLVDEVLSRSALPADIDLVVILVNDPQFGGSGGRYAVSSLDAEESMVHEVAHTFGLLADEYTLGSQGNCRRTSEPYENATRETQRDRIKWRHWIAETTPIPTTAPTDGVVGLYDGADHCNSGIYRPTYGSKMRVLGRPFEQVNTEILTRRIYNFVSPIDRVSPAVSEQRLARGARAEFTVDRPQPATHDLTVEWTLDGQAIGDGGAVTVDTSTLSPGKHLLQVTVRDATTFVRHDPNEALAERFQWVIEITP